MAKPAYAARRNKIVRQLKSSGMDALLVTNETNVTYLTGFSGDSSALLIAKNGQLIISDTRYTQQIKDECPGLEMQIRDSGSTMIEQFADAMQSFKISKVGVESDSVTHDQWTQMSEGIEKVKLVPTTGIVAKLRQIKDAWELEQIREAVRFAQRGFATLRAGLTGDKSELQVTHDLEHSMRSFGAMGEAFESIIAVGSNAALPHARPGKRLISESPILLVDWGAETSFKYRSDITRVLVTGKMSSKLEKVYSVVLDAQMAAIKAIRPGASCKAIDNIARSRIEKAGFGKNFGHGLGHSFGLEIHEMPRFSPLSDDKLQPGMVMTVEPGIYLPGWGGVRIEDDVLVTKDGHEVLTSVSKELCDQMVEL